MKKILSFIPIILFLGCAKQPVINKCTLNKNICETKCKLNYRNSDFKLKACEVKCETIYLGCKTKEKFKELNNK